MLPPPRGPSSPLFCRCSISIVWQKEFFSFQTLPPSSFGLFQEMNSWIYFFIQCLLNDFCSQTSPSLLYSLSVSPSLSPLSFRPCWLKYICPALSLMLTYQQYYSNPFTGLPSLATLLTGILIWEEKLLVLGGQEMNPLLVSRPDGCSYWFLSRFFCSQEEIFYDLLKVLSWTGPVFYSFQNNALEPSCTKEELFCWSARAQLRCLRFYLKEMRMSSVSGGVSFSALYQPFLREEENCLAMVGSTKWSSILILLVYTNSPSEGLSSQERLPQELESQLFRACRYQVCFLGRSNQKKVGYFFLMRCSISAWHSAVGGLPLPTRRCLLSWVGLVRVSRSCSMSLLDLCFQSLGLGLTCSEGQSRRESMGVVITRGGTGIGGGRSSSWPWRVTWMGWTGERMGRNS